MTHTQAVRESPFHAESRLAGIALFNRTWQRSSVPMPALAFRRDSNFYILSLGWFAFEILESPRKTSGYPAEGTCGEPTRRGREFQLFEDDSSPSLALSAPAGDTLKQGLQNQLAEPRNPQTHERIK